jgi:hypothetical protein
MLHVRIIIICSSLCDLVGQIYGLFSVNCQGLKFYNTLSSDIRNSSCIYKFQFKLKLFLFSYYILIMLQM